MSSDQAPSGIPSDNEYAKTTRNDPIPVKKDDEGVDTAVQAPTEFEGGENSDEQLAKDDAEAIDKSNIVKDRTRGAKLGSMKEPGDEEGLPGAEDGTSRGAQ